MIIYEWCQQSTKKNKHEHGVDYSSINAIFGIIRRIITDKKDNMIDDICDVVKVDETCLSSRQNNKERVLKNIWCFVGISRESKKMFLELAITRDMINLDTILSKNRKENMLTMTYCWRGYLNMENIVFLHETINHSRNFVDPEDKSIHFQNIKCLWTYLKKYIRSRGKNLKKLKYSFEEFKFLKNPFENFLKQISYLSFFNKAF
ncbi:hypothetical protein CDIK_3804 [Cucumispora dikerogammari]|nr:hypothetical protein CDIK_3804 [Cucumispora dikerogammari]